jgi:hypothetical protein
MAGWATKSGCDPARDGKGDFTLNSASLNQCGHVVLSLVTVFAQAKQATRAIARKSVPLAAEKNR